MLTRGDWQTSFVNGFPVLSNAKTLDRAVAISYKAFGVSDWSARLPIALSILALTIIVFFFGRSLFGWNASGLYAALIALTWPGTFLATRSLTSEAFACAATTLFAWALWHLLIRKRLPAGAAVAVSVVACLLILPIAGWPEMPFLLALALLCWLIRRFAPTGRQADSFLFYWTCLALAFTIGLQRQSPNPFLWLAPVPPMALLAGGWLSRTEAFSDRSNTLRIARYVFGLGTIVAVIAIFFALHGDLHVDIFHHPIVVTAPGGRAALIVAAIAILTGTIGNLVYRTRKLPRIANCFLAGALGGIIAAIQVAMVLASPRHSSQILADAIRPELNPTDIVVIDGRYQDASSLAFYLERPVLIALPPTPGTSVPVFVSVPPKGTASIDQSWTGRARVFLWTSVDHPLSVPGQSFVVARSGGKQILSNEPNSAGAAF